MNVNLKLAIRSVYLTQGEFAQDVGVSPSKVSMVIKEVIELKENEKTKWAKALKQPVKKLFAS
jgi:hypothetical protein